MLLQKNFCAATVLSTGLFHWTLGYKSLSSIITKFSPSRDSDRTVASATGESSGASLWSVHRIPAPFCTWTNLEPHRNERSVPLFKYLFLPQRTFPFLPPQSHVWQDEEVDIFRVSQWSAIESRHRRISQRYSTSNNQTDILHAQHRIEHFEWKVTLLASTEFVTLAYNP